ncbi:MAG: hypothetical protein AAFY82_02045 [Pseudomonadota bacterium]
MKPKPLTVPKPRVQAPFETAPWAPRLKTVQIARARTDLFA